MLWQCPYKDCTFRGTADEVDDHRIGSHTDAAPRHPPTIPAPSSTMRPASTAAPSPHPRPPLTR